MEIKAIEVVGFASAFKALRLPYGLDTRSDIETHFYGGEYNGKKIFDNSSECTFDDKDVALMSTLIKRGDEHAKPMRGVLAYADIIAPIDFWCELETYEKGRQRLFSGSTMHEEGRGLSGHALREAIHKIPYDRPIRKIDFFSYQCLRNIVAQRYDHRKAEWHFFIEWIKALPFADELILVGMGDKITIHNEYMRKYNANEI